MVSRFLSSILPLTLALPASNWCAAPQAPPEPRLVLLYAPCTVNREYLSPYDPAVDFTPALEAFSRDATVFERNTTESGQSGIAYASLFTGLQAPDHGVWRNPGFSTADLSATPEVPMTPGWKSDRDEGQTERALHCSN
jgi:hypothetical protein